MGLCAHFIQYVRNKKYRSMQKQAEAMVLKELDLMNMVKKERMQALSIVALLSSQ